MARRIPKQVAFAMLLRKHFGVEARIEFEMLEGMANAQSKEVQERTGGMLVYSPVVLDAEFEAAKLTNSSNLRCSLLTWRNKVTLFRKESGFISITWRNKVGLFLEQSRVFSVI